ncbi:MAG TPA: GNAT family N-acetyltransferase [Thermogutta sp.]|nr:GNAT family N-acetyltransferase [Thermogutta sp.]
MSSQPHHPPNGFGSPPLAVVPATGEGIRRGLWLLCKDLPEADRDGHLRRLREHFRRSPPGTTGILQAQRGQEIVGAILWTVYPGRTAVISAPGLLENEPLTTARALFRGVVDNLANTQTRLIFANFSQDQRHFREPVEEAGFCYLARLLYLFSPVADLPNSSEPPKCDLQFIPWPQVEHGDFVQIVEATYVDTLDCPKLNGLRETEDVLAGYRAAGVHVPDLWFLIRFEQEPVGCLILTEQPDFDQLELVYMGLIPKYRGRGWGKDVVRFAQWMARHRKRAGLLLAVDTQNTPAMRVYRSLGMQPLEERDVYLFNLTPRDGGTYPG